MFLHVHIDRPYLSTVAQCYTVVLDGFQPHIQLLKIRNIMAIHTYIIQSMVRTHDRGYVWASSLCTSRMKTSMKWNRLEQVSWNTLEVKCGMYVHSKLDDQQCVCVCVCVCVQNRNMGLISTTDYIAH